ncbi:hypothetical protein DLAC_01794 [Tieghemostelium lacteum]|uniref:Uncharacterized protein n=1 Tax=Tieghemostelium lacteum TaxID=361077 RepID=A0A152A6D2_TIELA|nr:hypothetical protein DLAC_01794 [Tieghemostelium lacteum]|eukprot:KYR01782.1 hypothetical protein DLAC_01794 [Tieghemostelium lacteum]
MYTNRINDKEEDETQQENSYSVENNQQMQENQQEDENQDDQQEENDVNITPQIQRIYTNFRYRNLNREQQEQQQQHIGNRRQIVVISSDDIEILRQVLNGTNDDGEEEEEEENEEQNEEEQDEQYEEMNYENYQDDGENNIEEDYDVVLEDNNDEYYIEGEEEEEDYGEENEDEENYQYQDDHDDIDIETQEEEDEEYMEEEEDEEEENEEDEEDEIDESEPYMSSLLGINHVEHPISAKYGTSGYIIYNKLLKSKLFQVEPGGRFLSQLVSYYSVLISHSNENQSKLSHFIQCLPELNDIKKMIENRRLHSKEFIPLKVILDISENYYRLNDSPIFDIYLKSVLPIIELFYSKIDNDKLSLVNSHLQKLLENIKDFQKIIPIYDKQNQYLNNFRQSRWNILNLTDGNCLTSYYR